MSSIDNPTIADLKFELTTKGTAGEFYELLIGVISQQQEEITKLSKRVRTLSTIEILRE